MVCYNTQRITMTKHRLTGEGGKGSTRRNSDEQAYADNWEKIFNREKEVYKELIQSRKGNKPKDIDEGEIDKS